MIEQVETLLKSQDTVDSSKDASRQDSTFTYVANTLAQGLPSSKSNTGIGQETQIPNVDTTFDAGTNGNAEQDFSWEIIGLGLEEPLPPQDVMDEL